MRVMITVIYTDKLPQVREFWEKHFNLPMDNSLPNTFSVFPLADSVLTYIDAASAGVAPSQGVVLRLLLPLTNLERERMIAEGVECSDLIVENWGSYYGEKVRYFMFADPGGIKIQIFEDNYGYVKQLMTTANGTETRKAPPLS